MAEINAYGSIASILGLIVSGLAFFAAKNAKEAAREIQNSFLFDKRIPMHLKVINKNLSNYNTLLEDIHGNKTNIKTLVSQLKPEVISLSKKLKRKNTTIKFRAILLLSDKIINREFYLESDQTKIQNRIEYFFKSFFLISHQDIWKLYIKLNELYSHVEGLKHDKKYLIK